MKETEEVKEVKEDQESSRSRESSSEFNTRNMLDYDYDEDRYVCKVVISD